MLLSDSGSVRLNPIAIFCAFSFPFPPFYMISLWDLTSRIGKKKSLNKINAAVEEGARSAEKEEHLLRI